MVFNFRAWRRARTARRYRVDAVQWQRVEYMLPFLDDLPSGDRARLREMALQFIADKTFAGAAGLQVTDDMRLSIALQACLPILNLGLEWYDGWVGIVVYPGDFIIRREEMDEHGVVHEYDDTVLGEAWPGGPVLLSWFDDLDALGDTNVIIHEFAHKLDMKNGEADGFPPLHADMNRAAWANAFAQAYADFCARVDAGEDTAIDPYAAEHPGEFFAVVSEWFFEAPAEVMAAYPRVYAQLAAFYRQDPLQRQHATPPHNSGGN